MQLNQIYSRTRMHLNLCLATLVILAVCRESVAEDCGVGFSQGADGFVKVNYVTKQRRGTLKRFVTEAEVSWEPQAMLSNPSCYDLKATTLSYKAVDEDTWNPTETDQRVAGKSYKWNVPNIKPCLKYQFRIQVVGAKEGVSEAFFELPDQLGPATEDEIEASKFKPEIPDDFSAKPLANSASISWYGSDCANSYQVVLSEAGDTSKSRTETVTDTKLAVGDLKPCTRYETTINAVLFDEYSDDLTDSFVTKPRLDAANNLKPVFTSSLDSVSVSWETWSSVSCINDYQVTVCNKQTKECFPTQTVSKSASLPTVSFKVDNLEPCTTYTLEVLPIFTETKIDKKLFDFKTDSPDASSLNIEEVSAISKNTHTMQVSWTNVECAASYRVYQKATNDDSWTVVADTHQQDMTVENITPCTKYHFAISAVLDSGEETAKTIGSEVVSDLDESDPFEAPNRHVKNADTHADVMWGHADCIASYLVKVCEEGYTECQEATVNPQQYIANGDNDRTISYKLDNLSPCTTYSLEIIPEIPGKMFTARLHTFTTTNGTPQPPTDFQVNLENNKADLKWSEVQCATSYKVHQKMSQADDTSTTEIVKNTRTHYVDLDRCETYEFAVSTLVAEQESSLTQWYSINVPPLLTEVPEMKILNNENDNITLKIEPSNSNNKCRISEFELSYSSDGGASFYTKTILTADLPGEDIVLAFQGASSPISIVRSRVRYEGNNDWSNSVSTFEPGDHSAIQGVNLSSDSSTVVPIVVGVIVAILIAGVVAFFLVRRKRNRNRYDPEKGNQHGKANGNTEESQKLNVDTNHPEA